MFKPNLSNGQVVSRYSALLQCIRDCDESVNALRGGLSFQSFLNSLQNGSICDTDKVTYAFLKSVAELQLESRGSIDAISEDFRNFVAVANKYGNLFGVAKEEVRTDSENTARTLGRYRSEFDAQASFMPEDKSLNLAFIVQDSNGGTVGRKDVSFSGTSDVAFLYLPRPAGIVVHTSLYSTPRDKKTFVDVELSRDVTAGEGWNNSWTKDQKSNFTEILALESLDSLNQYMIEKLAEKYASEVERSVGGN